MEALINIQDDIDVAANFMACAYLACQSSTFPNDERRALCAVLDVAREKLALAGAALQVLINSKKNEG